MRLEPNPARTIRRCKVKAVLLIRFTPRPSAFAKTVATGLRRPVALLGPSPEPARPLARPSVCGRPGTPRGCLSAFHAEWSQPDKH